MRSREGGFRWVVVVLGVLHATLEKGDSENADLSNIYPSASDGLCDFKIEQNYSVTVRATCYVRDT